MPFKITMPKKFQKLLDPNSKDGLVSKTRKEFSKRGTKKVKQAIVQDIIRGISPVKGKGKWKRYSPSYKDVIKGRATFFRSGGKVVRLDKKALATGKELKSLRASPQARRSVRNDKARKVKFINQRHAEFQSKASPTKQVSPVNLRYSGDLHRSLKVFTRGGFLRNFRMVTQFKHFLADIHNRLGAGKSKVKRRLLPTNRGEKFNVRIDRVIFTELKKAADIVAKQFSGQ